MSDESSKCEYRELGPDEVPRRGDLMVAPSGSEMELRHDRWTLPAGAYAPHKFRRRVSQQASQDGRCTLCGRQRTSHRYDDGACYILNEQGSFRAYHETARFTPEKPSTTTDRQAVRELVAGLRNIQTCEGQHCASCKPAIEALLQKYGEDKLDATHSTCPNCTSLQQRAYGVEKAYERLCDELHLIVGVPTLSETLGGRVQRQLNAATQRAEKAEAALAQREELQEAFKLQMDATKAPESYLDLMAERDTLRQKLAECERERDAWKQRAGALGCGNENYQREINTLRAEVARLREVFEEVAHCLYDKPDIARARELADRALDEGKEAGK